jgi:hypothetical protein
VIWSDIPGFFDWARLYDEQVAAASAGDILVEVGCWKGRSLCYLGTAAKAAAKGLQVYGIDHGLGDSTPSPFIPYGASYYDELVANVAACGLDDGTVQLLRLDAIDAGPYFALNSIRLLFIDGEHTPAGIAGQIKALIDRVMPGGLVAGHDWIGDQPNTVDVPGAVQYVFGGAANDYPFVPTCWAVTV